MTDEQVDELSECFDRVLSNYLDYLDLGNPEIPGLKRELRDELLDIVETFGEKYWDIEPVKKRG